MTATNGCTPTPRVVGALACQQDSYLRELETVVVNCEELAVTPSKGAKSKKKKGEEDAQAAGKETTDKTWLIECEDSVLFPEGGGQPFDQGKLVVLSGDTEEEIPINNVQRHGLRCMIYSPKPLSEGTRVRQIVDHQRRWDFMQQHTGQHLLSGILEKEHGIETLGWGMNTDGGMNYVDLKRKPSPEEMIIIKNRCTELIRENLPITVEVPEDARKDKLPDDYDSTNGVIRVVTIGDIDRDSCCGTHLSQTSHLSLLLLGSTHSIHGQDCRLYFMVGDRAVALATSSLDGLTSLGKLFSTGSTADAIFDKASKMSENVSELRRRERRLLADVARFEAQAVRSRLSAGRDAWVYRADGSLDFLNSVVNGVKEDLKGSNGVVVLAAGEEKKAGPIVIVGQKDAVESMVTKVQGTVSGVKGGGKGERWQGKVGEWQRQELSALQDLVEAPKQS